MGGQRKMPVSAHKKTAYGRKISFSHFFSATHLKTFSLSSKFHIVNGSEISWGGGQEKPYTVQDQNTPSGSESSLGY